jgi:predicted DNA-binding antitoxin AbrB/MazE fold protein
MLVPKRGCCVKGTVEAVFQNGVLRPTQPLQLAEGDHVRLIIERVTQASPDAILRLARQVYDGLSQNDINEIEEMARHRALFTDVRS